MSSFIPRSLLDNDPYADAQITSRMSMFPVGTYANPNDPQHDQLGLAWPGMISEPVNALARLMGTPSHPGSLWDGPNNGIESDNPVRSYHPNQQDMTTLLESTIGGNATDALFSNATKGAGAAESVAADAGASGLRPGLSVTTRGGGPGTSGTWWDIGMHGDPIGKAYIRENPQTIQNSNFMIDPEWQRQGIGTEVQRHLAETYGKPTVPDFNLSEAALQRWKKNDPAAVADYKPWFEGAGQHSPAPLSDAFFAAQGGPPVAGTRAASGELFSDTAAPSLPGALIAGAQDDQDPRRKAMNALFNF